MSEQSEKRYYYRFVEHTTPEDFEKSMKLLQEFRKQFELPYKDISLEGKNFVILGSKWISCYEAEELIEARGGECWQKLSYDTDYLVIGDEQYQKYLDSTTKFARVKYAMRLQKEGSNLEIINYDTLFRMLSPTGTYTPMQETETFYRIEYFDREEDVDKAPMVLAKDGITITVSFDSEFQGDSRTEVDYPFDNRFEGKSFAFCVWTGEYYFLTYLVKKFGGRTVHDVLNSTSYIVCDAQIAEQVRNATCKTHYIQKVMFLNSYGSADIAFLTIDDFKALLPTGCYGEVLELQKKQLKEEEAEREAKRKYRQEIESAMATPDDRFKNLHFVLSGDFRDHHTQEEIERMIKSLGGTVDTRVTKVTDILVLGSDFYAAHTSGADYVSGKHEQAKKYGTRILSWQELFEMMK